MAADKHIPVLDSLRAFAALSVCLFHFICTVIGFIDSELVKSIFFYGHYGVQTFFVISGFIIPWSLYHSNYRIGNYFRFALKRFVRLEPPYLVSLVVAIALTYLRTLSPHYNGVDTTPSFSQIALHIGYLIPFFEGQTWIRQVYWTLAIEFQYYLLIGLLFPVLARKGAALRILSYLILLSGPLLMNDFLLFFFPVFLLGIVLFLYKSEIVSAWELAAVTCLATAEILMFHDAGTLVFSLIAYFAILFFTGFKNRVLTFLGSISYSVYLFHGLTGLVLLNFFSHTVDSPVVKFLLVIVALVVTIISSYLVYRFVEFPSKSLSSRIKIKKEQKDK